MEEKLEFSTVEKADFGQRIIIPIENWEEQNLQQQWENSPENTPFMSTHTKKTLCKFSTDIIC